MAPGNVPRGTLNPPPPPPSVPVWTVVCWRMGRMAKTDRDSTVSVPPALGHPPTLSIKTYGRAMVAETEAELYEMLTGCAYRNYKDEEET